MLHVMNEMPSQVHLPTQITQHANEWNETEKGLRNQNASQVPFALLKV